MKRRGFLGLFAGAIAGATLDPERALWIPGAKTISIPKPNLDVTRMMADDDYSRLFVDVLDMLYYGYFQSFPAFNGTDRTGVICE